LRGLAILAVLLAHLTYMPEVRFSLIFQYGRLGVDLFFVLSGFLITGILLDSKEIAGYFKNFYARRALRIWPLYYAVLVIFFGLLPLFLSPPTFATDIRTWAYYATYAQNLFLHFPHSVPLQPTWSLAVEEQYYMVWALVVFFSGRAALRNWLVGMIVFSFSLRASGYFHGASLEFMHNFTLCRLEPLAAGGLAGLWLRSRNCNLRRWNRGAWIALLIGCGGVLLSLVDWGVQSLILSYPFVASAFAGLLAIALTANPSTSSMGKALTQKWLTYTGKISYGIYLIHVPIFMAISCATRHILGTAPPSLGLQLLVVLAGFGSVYLVASLSWRFFERPILRWKEKFRPSGPALRDAVAR
jgi:peptidoglycan/LPS O-acetylase OafA/YrhL